MMLQLQEAGPANEPRVLTASVFHRVYGLTVSAFHRVCILCVLHGVCCLRLVQPCLCSASMSHRVCGLCFVPPCLCTVCVPLCLCSVCLIPSYLCSVLHCVCGLSLCSTICTVDSSLWFNYAFSSEPVFHSIICVCVPKCPRSKLCLWSIIFMV